MGQHRVFGFTFAKTILRVPVVIFNGLSRQDETRLFIDINTKQRPVPNELLLDIKRLAEYETDQERILSAVYDMFAEQNDSPLLGLMSPMSRASGKISRVTFNAALRPLIPIFRETDPESIYAACNAYVIAFLDGTKERKLDLNVTNPTIFRAIMMLFPEIARRVKDRFAGDYTVTNFLEVMSPMLARLKRSTFKNPGNSQRALFDVLLRALQSGFSI